MKRRLIILAGLTLSTVVPFIAALGHLPFGPICWCLWLTAKSLLIPEPGGLKSPETK